MSKIVGENIQNQAEIERINLAKELGNNLQAKVNEKKTPGQKVLYGEWKLFIDLEDFANYLASEYGLWVTGRPNLFSSDFKKRFKRLGNQYSVSDHMHSLKEYPQRIPYGVLLRIKEAKECGLERFWIVDPDLQATRKGDDPFLLGQMVGNSSLNYYLICNWDDKNY